MSTETSNQNQHFHQNGICSSIRVWTQNIFSHFAWDQTPNWVYHPKCSSIFQLLILLQNKIQMGSKSRKPCRVGEPSGEHVQPDRLLLASKFPTVFATWLSEPHVLCISLALTLALTPGSDVLLPAYDAQRTPDARHDWDSGVPQRWTWQWW